MRACVRTCVRAGRRLYVPGHDVKEGLPRPKNNSNLQRQLLLSIGPVTDCARWSQLAYPHNQLLSRTWKNRRPQVRRLRRSSTLWNTAPVSILRISVMARVLSLCGVSGYGWGAGVHGRLRVSSDGCGLTTLAVLLGCERVVLARRRLVVAHRRRVVAHRRRVVVHRRLVSG